MRVLSIRPRLVEQVYNVILDAICAGRIAPGERLAQERIAKTLEVSRQPVGQALSLLKSQGFVCDAGRRGLMVAPLDKDFVRELYEFRAVMDLLSAGRIARAGDRDIAARGESIVKEGREAAAAGSIERLIAADMAFHGLLYEAAGNSIVVETMNLHWNHIRRIMSAILSMETYSGDRVWTEHEAILAAVVAGDAAVAERLARAHADGASADLQWQLAEQELEVGSGLRAGASRSE